MNPLFALGLCALAAAGSTRAAPVSVHEAERVRYDGHQVLQVTPATSEDVQSLDLIGRNFNLDWWRVPSVVGRSASFRVSPEQYPAVQAALAALGMHATAVIGDVEELIVAQRARPTGYAFLGGPSADFNYSVYHTNEELDAFVTSICAEHSAICTTEVIGQTHEKRQLLLAKVTGKGGASNPVFWTDYGIHAREWISPATGAFMLGRLLEEYGKDSRITGLVDAVQFYFLIVFNKDGYSFTWTSERMWRKTRTPNANSTCIGTDPNRNWPFHWGEGGTSSNPCAETFEGPSANSEPCVQAVIAYLSKIPNLKGYINFHSYSQLWMTPWGYTDARPKDYTEQNDLSRACTTALTAVHGTKYVYGPIAPTIYVASGNSVDWTYGQLGVVYSTAVELRDTGRYGFLLPPDQIVPSGEETLAGILVFAEAIAKGQ